MHADPNPVHATAPGSMGHVDSINTPLDVDRSVGEASNDRGHTTTPRVATPGAASTPPLPSSSLASPGFPAQPLEQATRDDTPDDGATPPQETNGSGMASGEERGGDEGSVGLDHSQPAVPSRRSRLPRCNARVPLLTHARDVLQVYAQPQELLAMCMEQEPSRPVTIVGALVRCCHTRQMPLLRGVGGISVFFFFFFGRVVCVG